MDLKVICLIKYINKSIIKRTMEIKKAAIIGMGPMGFRHLKAYSRLDNVKVTSVCDLNPEIQNKIPDDINYYTNYKELLDKEKPDIVSVVTTGPYHAMIVIDCAENGAKRILCEKPMATNIKDAEEMIAICQKNGTQLAINHVFREYDTYKKLVEMLKGGSIGEIRHIHCVDGGGRLGCTGTHFFDNMRMFSGSEADWVIGSLDKNYQGDHKGRRIYDPGGYGIIKFKNGVRATIELCEDIGCPELMVITGSVGRIIIDKNNNEYKISARNDKDKKKKLGEYDLPLHKISFDPGKEFDVLEATKETIRKLCHDLEVNCTAENGKASLEIALAFHISEKENNKKIFLSFKEKDFNVDIT